MTYKNEHHPQIVKRRCISPCGKDQYIFYHTWDACGMLGGGLTLLLGFQVWLKSVGACQVDKGWTVVALQHVNMTRLFFSHNSLPSVFTIRVERKRYFVQGFDLIQV